MRENARVWLLVVFAMVVEGATLAWAGVEGTHHDMRLFGGEEEQSVCTYCHVPHRASTGEGLLTRTGTHEAELGAVGSFCYTCHDGTVVPTALIEAPDGTVGLEALTRSHGLRVGNLEEATGGLEDADNVETSGLVPTGADGRLPNRMDCTACHDPHNNENPPFLRKPLDELCVSCHSGSDRLGRGRYTSVEDVGERNGAHPVGMPVVFSGKDRARPEQTEPEMVFGPVATELKVPGLKEVERESPDFHWETGGHLDDFGTDPSIGKVTCSTCHSAHSTSKDLLVLKPYDGQIDADPLCAGCHGKEGDVSNPGGTPFYHPVGIEGRPPYETSTVPTRALSISLPGQWPLGDGGALLCATCHRMHQGRPGSKALRDNDQGLDYICDVCHQVDDDVSDENAHHLTSLDDVSAVLRGRSLSWAGAPGEPGDLSDGLTCIDCHTELAKSAHNW